MEAPKKVIVKVDEKGKVTVYANFDIDDIGYLTPDFKKDDPEMYYSMVCETKEMVEQ
jgi:hypothetical protein